MSQLEECPRSTLDSDVVLYLTSDDQRAPFLLHIDEQGRFLVPRTDTNTDMCNSCSSSSSSSIHRDTTKATVLTSVQPPTTSSVNSSSSSGVNSIRMSPKLHYELLDTGPDGWIFVVRGGHFFAHCKQTKSFPRCVMCSDHWRPTFHCTITLIISLFDYTSACVLSPTQVSSLHIFRWF